MDSSRYCYLCDKNSISTDSINTILDLQGIPNSADEKLNILKVVCQLFRVRWESIENLFLKNLCLPFCLGCLKNIVQIIVLREQLFAIETDIRLKIFNFENAVSRAVKNENWDPKEMPSFEEENFEKTENYDEGRQFFQKQVLAEFLSKQLLHQKVEELQLQLGEIATELNLSLVQLNFQKNVFEITGEGPKVQNPKPIDIPKEDFCLSLVSPHNDEIFVVDDCDYSSPSKKIKTGNDIAALDPIAEIARKLQESDNDSDWHAKSDDACLTDSNSDDEFGFKKKSKNRTKSPKTKNQKSPKKSQTFNSLVLPRNGVVSTSVAVEVPFSSNSQHPIGSDWLEQLAEMGKTVATSKELCPNVVVEQDFRKFRAYDGTLWTTTVPKAVVSKQKSKNQEVSEGSLVGPVTNSSTNSTLSPAQLFKLMLPSSVVDIMMKQTNGAENQTASSWKHVTTNQIYAYIGILIKFGVENKRQLPLRDAWKEDQAMTFGQFMQISKDLGFEEPLPGPKSKNAAAPDQSKLTYVAEIFDAFTKNVGTHLLPKSSLIVDEMLLNHEGKVRLKIHLDPGSDKSGMKVWVLCDATTGYVLRLCIYEGDIDVSMETELGKKVVMGLVEKYFKSDLLVTTDSFFTSKALGRELLNRNLKMLGMLKSDRKDVIAEFLEGRDPESSIFAFQRPFSMVSYTKETNKIVLSTSHLTPEINPNFENMPQALLDYNLHKSGISGVDNMLENFSCQRTTTRWPLKVFQIMCDVAVVNAYAIWKIHHPNEAGGVLEQRRFLEGLVQGLLQGERGALTPTSKKSPQVGKSNGSSAKVGPKSRTTGPGTSRPIVVMDPSKVIDPMKLPDPLRVLGPSGLGMPPPPPPPTPNVGIGACFLCTRGTPSSSKCAGCAKFICVGHSNRIIHCENCPFVRVFVVQPLQ